MTINLTILFFNKMIQMNFFHLSKGLTIEESSDGVRIIQANGGEPINISQKIFRCDKCPRIYGVKSDLRVHQLTHSNDRTFECWLCHKA